VSVSGTARVQTDFDYDLAGNRVRATINERGRDRRVIDYSYNEAGELVLKSDSRYGTTAFGFDRSGNNVSQVRTADGVSTITNYSFDALGRLEAIDTGGRLLLAVLYDADNNRVMSASRNPDPEVAVPDGGVFFAAVDVDSEEETRTADLDEDATNNHTPNVRVSEHDLFWYGVAQGVSNLSHMATYLTQWLNSIWTLDLEATRHDFVSANQRESHARELVDLLYVPDGVVAPSYEIDTELYTVTRYINDTNRTYARTLAEYDEDGTWRTNFIYDTGIFGVNGVIGMNNVEGSAERFLTDGRGSVTEMVERRGDITTYRYDAFGNIRTQGDSANPFTYNQERFDFGVELQYLRARYVDLGLGRFVSRDSVLGTLEDPRTHNLFLYVANDPLSHIDPSGHVMIVGSNINQTVTVWNRCPQCRNGDTPRNIPADLDRCPRCTRHRRPCHVPRCGSGRRLPIGGRCFVCGISRRPLRQQTKPPVGPHRIPADDGQSNVGNKTGLADRLSKKKNSNATPGLQTSARGQLRFRGASIIQHGDIQFSASFQVDVEGLINLGTAFVRVPARLLEATAVIPSDIAGGIARRATLRYSPWVVLQEGTSGNKIRITIPKRTMTHMFVAFSSHYVMERFIQERAVEVFMEQNLRSTATNHARARGMTWAYGNGVVPRNAFIEVLRP